MKRVMVIVDGYSGGVHLAPKFKKAGVKLVHVESNSKIWKFVRPTFNDSFFLENFSMKQMNFEVLVKKISKFEPMGFIAGTETGVELADQLSNFFKIKENDIKKSSAKRDKYEMLLACQRAGVPVGGFAKISNIEQLLRYYKNCGYKRAVVKPINSAGSDGVYFCKTENELVQAFMKNKGQENKLGLNNNEVLVCEYLEGNEYFLNTVSFKGRHTFTDIWRYEKRNINNSNAVYDRNILCDFDGEVETQLKDYAEKVIDALGISYGPSHIEVMMTSVGPKLIELGARLDGLTLPEVNRTAVGYSPVDLICDVYAKNSLSKSGYTKRKYANTVYLTLYEEGELVSFKGESEIKKLPSFYQLSMRVKNGGTIKKTKNYFSAPGFLTLIADNKEQLDKDYQYIRDLEKNNELFKVRS